MSAFQLFGPSRKEIWNRLCAEMGAEYVKGGFWKGDHVEAIDKNGTITLDTYHANKQTFTRLRAPFTNRDGFEFTIYRRGFFSDLGKRLGMQDIEVGHQEFDHDFIIKGNDEPKLRRLFDNPKIRGAIAAQPRILLKIETESREPGSVESNGVLQFTAIGVLKDLGRLKQLFELFADTLDHLTSMGTAAPPAARP